MEYEIKAETFSIVASVRDDSHEGYEKYWQCFFNQPALQTVVFVINIEIEDESRALEILKDGVVNFLTMLKGELVILEDKIKKL